MILRKRPLERLVLGEKRTPPFGGGKDLELP